MFIKLNHKWSEETDSFYLNVFEINAVYSLSGRTYIAYSGKNMMLEVVETPEEVLEKIGDRLQVNVLPVDVNKLDEK
ncbi:hypothetical protein CIRMBP1271_02102 [Enterococcus cecorum]|uniref:hypothetical protein n=1 Tax=Enterococcus cecorum TaxID=44008 RepID=UPI0022CF79D7|nr:hypothetical protein [Enterococcus cecorum]CAI3254115.1 hypothetical protein CIRMBP1267_00046 [Enterococcus cecorum]CAI3386686.1 hypothetical protein CIRMBP1274_01414 [Enterococcus cecorum]CAI3441189.1 hypothetical protein CIRMBP1240_02070 [Enterococcus cecorum]CAI3443619.1 hypothetical protein CIRMBP1265_02004 [Enterococcus cecorum]CAI3449813.1 hypothetical protein CIRMBP1276_02026 [Enterococcus cecorum]